MGPSPPPGAHACYPEPPADRNPSRIVCCRAMEVSRASDRPFTHGGDTRVTGEVSLGSTLADDEGTNLGIVHFAAGARTHWHRHAGGQFLFCLSGRGRVRTRGEAGHVLLPGDVIR